MNAKYTIFKYKKIIKISFTEIPDAEDVIDTTIEVAKLEKNELRLWNFQKGVNFTSAELLKIADSAKIMNFPPSKIAILVPNKLSFGLARMHEVFREEDNQSSHVFETEQEALDWLLEKKS